jgi:hypothetical protein
MSFYDIWYEVRKKLEVVSEGIGIILKIRYKEFCWEFDFKLGEVNFDLAWYN